VQLDHAALLIEQGESVAQVTHSLKVGQSMLYEALTARTAKLLPYYRPQKIG
jgi:hypothetical protein